MRGYRFLPKTTRKFSNVSIGYFWGMVEQAEEAQNGDTAYMLSHAVPELFLISKDVKKSGCKAGLKVLAGNIITADDRHARVRRREHMWPQRPGGGRKDIRTVPDAGERVIPVWI